MALAGHMSNVHAVCVSTAQSLELELYKWTNEDGDKDIQLVQGTYNLADTLGLSLLYQSTNGNRLYLRGGYVAGTNCASRVLDPGNTIITGGGLSKAQVNISGNNDMLVEGIGIESMPWGAGFGVDGDSTVNLHMHHCLARNIINSSGLKTLTVSGHGSSSLHFDNNLVYGNQTSTGEVLYIYTDGKAYANNNTITDNSGGLLFLGGASATVMLAANNILWNNGSFDFKTTNTSVSPTLSHTIYATSFGPFFDDLTNKNNISPQFVDPAQHNYRLPDSSPAVNAGASSIPVAYASTDIAGKDRIVGSHIDMGAYENQTNDDLNNFTVTSSLDASHASNSNVNCNAGSTTCTLREALIRSNSDPLPSKISFNLSSCPAILNLSSVLPDVTSTATIDGYTQPGALFNTAKDGFNPNLCILLNGGSSVAYGLRTGSGSSLTLRGLMFAGFTAEALELQGGSNHLITGNQIGALLAPANVVGIHVGGGTGSTRIGAFDDVRTYNLISGSTASGISIDSTAGGVLVAYNLIGLGRDGTSTIGNYTGIAIYNSPNNTLMYNHIAGNTTYGVNVSGPSAAGNFSQYNDIGVDMAGGCAGNGAAGVLISFGAHDSTLGAVQNGTFGGNQIACNAGAGIWLSTTAGTGNRLLQNYGSANGGLAIDLGQGGPTANDAKDTDNGPNSAQNYPTVLNAFRTSAAEWLEITLDSTANATFRLDFYSSPGCSSLGSPPRGLAATAIGRGSAMTDGSGQAHVWVKLPMQSAAFPSYIAATATAANGDTSEIGTCAQESNDLIFRDDLGG